MKKKELIVDFKMDYDGEKFISNGVHVTDNEALELRVSGFYDPWTLQARLKIEQLIMEKENLSTQDDIN